MLRFADRTIRRLGLAFIAFVALSFAAPAFASHICAESAGCAPSVQVAADPSSNGDGACPDCGPACANGCCHAPHAATAPDTLVSPRPPLFAVPAAWADATGQPLDALKGPKRPPRA
ncbi:hypothetical protein MMB232_01567 [Brevundimonas subvibrioides]|uniref:hypothetical protein n=1 Tax=Brevundimonas subvibrioides TaxID=74313 RepID=UPI0032D57639